MPASSASAPAPVLLRGCRALEAAVDDDPAAGVVHQVYLFREGGITGAHIECLRALTDTLERADLGSLGLGDSYVERLFREITVINPDDGLPDRVGMDQLFPLLRTLNLGGNWIERDGCAALALWLHSNRSLKDLQLRMNRISADGCVMLMRPMASHAKLSRLDLSGNRIGPSAGEAIADAIAAAPTLRDLNLAGNPLGPGAQPIARACTVARCLRRINMSMCEISRASASAIAEMLASPALKEVLLAANPLEDDTIALLPPVLAENARLRWLDLSDCLLSDRALDTLGRALRRNSALSHVALRNNSLSFDAVFDFLVQLSKHGNPNRSSRALHIDLSDNPAGTDKLARSRILGAMVSPSDLSFDVGLNTVADREALRRAKLSPEVLGDLPSVECRLGSDPGSVDDDALLKAAQEADVDGQDFDDPAEEDASDDDDDDFPLVLGTAQAAQPPSKPEAQDDDDDEDDAQYADAPEDAGAGVGGDEHWSESRAAPDDNAALDRMVDQYRVPDIPPEPVEFEKVRITDLTTGEARKGRVRIEGQLLSMTSKSCFGSKHWMDVQLQHGTHASIGSTPTELLVMNRAMVAPISIETKKPAMRDEMLALIERRLANKQGTMQVGGVVGQ